MHQHVAKTGKLVVPGHLGDVPLKMPERRYVDSAIVWKLRKTASWISQPLHSLTLKGGQQFPFCSRDFQIAYIALSWTVSTECYVKRPARLRNRGYNLAFSHNGNCCMHANSRCPACC